MALEEYTFLEKHSHEIDWDSKEVYLVDNEKSLFEVSLLSWRWETIYVDMEGENFGNQTTAKIGLVQVAISSNVIFLFDIVSCEESLQFIRKLVESEDVQKVFHACSGDISALAVKTGGNINPKKVFDTQVAQQVIDNPDNKSYNLEGYSLKDVHKKQIYKDFPQINTNVNCPHGNKWLDQRPMTERMIKYAAADVMSLPDIYRCQQYELMYSPMYLREKISRLTEGKIQNKMNFKNIPKSIYESCSYKDVEESPTTLEGSDEFSSVVGWCSGVKESPSTSSSRHEQAESPGLETALAAVGAVAIGVGALAMLWLGKQRKNR